jgi:E3 ubiquitin-protein ligase SHPRH
VQWERGLQIVEQALRDHGVGYTQLKGSTHASKLAARRFKTDPGVSVFLLAGKHQSSGLTLVAATHVFLLEPILNRYSAALPSFL